MIVLPNNRVAVDLDDVVLDFVGGLCEAVHTEYGVKVPQAAITDFNLKPFLDPIIGRSWWSWMRDRDWLWSHFPAVPGAIGTLDRLRREGFYLELVTSKPEWAEHNVLRWLGKWRPPFNQVTIVGPKDRKVDFTDAFVLVDDKLDNLVEFSAEGRFGILFTRPHNTKYELLPPRVVRADDWLGVYNELRRLKNGASN